jgi:hypothetical protein
MKPILIITCCLFLLLSSAIVHAEMPLGYPWSTWGVLSHSLDAKTEKGLKLDTYLEQGIDWLKIGNSDFVLNTYLGLGITLSDHSQDYWNNKIGPRVGVKIKHPISIKDGWGQFAFGAQWEYYSYTTDSKPVNNDSRFVVFLQWGMGGDWKKK